MYGCDIYVYLCIHMFTYTVYIYKYWYIPQFFEYGSQADALNSLSDYHPQKSALQLITGVLFFLQFLWSG